MDGTVEGLQKLPKDRCRGVTHYRPIATSEHRCHEAPVEAQAAVANGIDAVVNAVQLPTFHAPRDGVLANPNLMQLGNRHRPMLPSGDLGHP